MRFDHPARITRVVPAMRMNLVTMSLAAATILSAGGCSARHTASYDAGANLRGGSSGAGTGGDAVAGMDGATGGGQGGQGGMAGSVDVGGSVGDPGPTGGSMATGGSVPTGGSMATGGGVSTGGSVATGGGVAPGGGGGDGGRGTVGGHGSGGASGGGAGPLGGMAGANVAGGEAVAAMAALDGQKYLMPCGPNQSASWLVCQNYPPGTTDKCPTVGPFLTKGFVMRDDTITIGGVAGAIYDVTLRVRGVVEPKHYINGLAGAPANGTNYGWYVGGEPHTAGDYGKYVLWVSAPIVLRTGTLDGQYYFLNAIDQFEQHFSYPIDYTVTLPIAAGAQIRFLAADSNCSMIKNCDDTSRDGIGATSMCHPITVPDLPTAAGIMQPYPGQFIHLTVVAAVKR